MLSTHELANQLLAQPDQPVTVKIGTDTLEEHFEACMEDGTEFTATAVSEGEGGTEIQIDIV